MPDTIDEKHRQINFNQFKFNQQDDVNHNENPLENPLLEGQIPAWKFQSNQFSMRKLTQDRQKKYLDAVKKFENFKRSVSQDREQAKRELVELKRKHEAEMLQLVRTDRLN